MPDELETAVEAPSGSTEAPTAEVDTPVTPETVKGLTEARDKYLNQRDEARERVSRFQRAEIERLAGKSLSMPGDLFALSGNEIGDYLTEDGEVDPDKVAADVAAILAERPGLEKPRSPVGYDPSAGTGGAAPKGTPTWSDLLKR